MMQPNTPARDPLAEIGNFVFLRDEPQPADVIFITGGAYPEVGERAAALWRQGLAPVILPSGRYSVHDGRFIGAQSLADRYPGPYATEWEFLRDVCVKNGVDETAFLKEDRAVSTWDNARFSRRRPVKGLHFQFHGAPPGEIVDPETGEVMQPLN